MAGAKMKLVSELTMTCGMERLLGIAITITMTINGFAKTTVVFQEEVILVMLWRR